MKTLLRAVLFTVASSFAGRPGEAQIVDPTFAAVDVQQSGTVYNALQQPDGKYLVGGSFTQINGSPAVGLARLNADGSLDQAFTSTAACQSTILKIRLLANGQILLHGYDTFRVGGRTFSSLAKLNADGSVVTGFSVGSGMGSPPDILAIAEQADGKILVSGTFTSFGGVATNNLVRLNADGSVDQAFTAALGAGFVRAGNPTNLRGLAVQPDGKILVGGDFRNYNNTGRGGLVRLNPDGSLDTSFSPMLSGPAGAITVLALALDSRTNYVVVYGVGAQSIVRLNTSGQVDNSFRVLENIRCTSTGYNNSDEFAVDANGRVLLSGCFTNYGGVNGNSYVTRFLADGQLDSQFAVGRQLDDQPRCIRLLANGDVLLAGSFGRYGSIRNVNLVRLNDNAQVMNTPRAAIMQRGTVQEIVQQADGKLLIGGRFWQINGQMAGNIARLNQDGTLDPSFQLIGVDGFVRQIALQPNGRIIVGGEFATVGSRPSPVVARLLADGTADASFTAPPITPSGGATYTSMQALALDAEGSILVGGPTINMGGYISTLHRLLPNGSIDASYAGRVGAGVLGSNVVSLLVLPDGKHYVGGSSFSSGTTAPGLVRLNADGSRDNTFTAGASATTSSLYISKLLALPNNQVLVGGSFSNYNGAAYSNLVRLNADGTVDTEYRTPVLGGSPVSALARYVNGRVLLGSNFVTVNDTGRGSLIRLNPDGSYDTSFANVIDSPWVTALALQPNESIVVGGGFTSINGQAWATSLARITAPNVLAVSGRQSTARTDAWPNPAHGHLNLSLDAAAKPQKLVLFDALGKTVLSQVVTKAEVSLPLHTISAGVYLLRVDYADGPVTRRVVVE